MKFKTLVYLFAVVLLASCGNQAEKQTETTTAVNPDSLSDFPSIPDSVVLGAGAFDDFTADYEGSINDKYEISMHLTKVGNSIGGYYSYKNKGAKIWLNGSVLEDGSMEIPEINKGKVTGVFKGKMADNKFVGTWSKADNSQSMPFSVSQTSIASMKEKSDVLSSAIGQYYLRSISGNVGANAMFDTYKDKGNWVSNGSNNIGGEREGYDNKLTKQDIDLLNNLHVVVDDNRDVHVYAGLTELVKSPYKAEGMDYRVNEKDKSKMHERIAELKANQIKYEYKYVLVANDKISFTETLKGSFDLVSENNMILTYIPIDNTFELEIFFGTCCDSNVLIFEKK